MENDNYNTGGTGANLFAGKSADAANGQVQTLNLTTKLKVKFSDEYFPRQSETSTKPRSVCPSGSSRASTTTTASMGDNNPSNPL